MEGGGGGSKGKITDPRNTRRGGKKAWSLEAAKPQFGTSWARPTHALRQNHLENSFLFFFIKQATINLSLPQCSLCTLVRYPHSKNDSRTVSIRE